MAFYKIKLSSEGKVLKELEVDVEGLTKAKISAGMMGKRYTDVVIEIVNISDDLLAKKEKGKWVKVEE